MIVKLSNIQLAILVRIETGDSIIRAGEWTDERAKGLYKLGYIDVEIKDGVIYAKRTYRSIER